jgi:hypothetical protein
MNFSRFGMTTPYSSTSINEMLALLLPISVFNTRKSVSPNLSVTCGRKMEIEYVLKFTAQKYIVCVLPGTKG